MSSPEDHEEQKVIQLSDYRRSKEEMQEFDEFLQSIVVLKNREHEDLPDSGMVELIIDHGVNVPEITQNPDL